MKDFFAALRNPDGSIRSGCNEYATPLQFKEDLDLHLRALIQDLLAKGKKVQIQPSKRRRAGKSKPTGPKPEAEL